MDAQLTSTLASHQLYLERVATSLGDDVVPYLERINERIEKVLKKYKGRSITPTVVEQIMEQVEVITQEEFSAYVREFRGKNAQVGAYESQFLVSTYSAIYVGDYAAATASEVARSARLTPINTGKGYTTYNYLLRNYSQQQQNRINATVQESFFKSTTIREVAAYLEEQLNISKTGTTDSQMDITRRSTLTMARTGVSHMSYSAMDAFIRDNEDLIVAKEAVATLDSRTSQICRSIDGLIVEREDPQFNSFSNPFQPNCLLGDTDVSTCSRVNRVYRRAYEGTIIEITTSSSKSISITPNHPVLTNSGWVAAKLINSGDKVATISLSLIHI